MTLELGFAEPDMKMSNADADENEFLTGTRSSDPIN